MKKYLARDANGSWMATVDAETPQQAAFIAASANAKKIGLRDVDVIVSDESTRWKVKLEGRIWYNVAEVSEQDPITVA